MSSPAGGIAVQELTADDAAWAAGLMERRRQAYVRYSPVFWPAPPVYDPGGPVLLADRLADGADLAEVERESAGMGAVLLIVPAAPGSARTGQLGRRPGWSVASDWYLGRPAAT